MFAVADLVVLTKVDLLPHVDFDVARACRLAAEPRDEVARALRENARRDTSLARLAGRSAIYAQDLVIKAVVLGAAIYQDRPTPNPLEVSAQMVFAAARGVLLLDVGTTTLRRRALRAGPHGICFAAQIHSAIHNHLKWVGG